MDISTHEILTIVEQNYRYPDLNLPGNGKFQNSKFPFPTSERKH